jgi:hypothetical protein
MYPGWYHQHKEFTLSGHMKIQMRVAEHHFQHWLSVNMWYGIGGNNLNGPDVIEQCLPALYHRNFLENELPLHSEDVLLSKSRQMWLQHDGVPLYFSRAVMEFLNKDYE